MVEDCDEFYWDIFFVKVEDKIFSVPRGGFVQSSEVFADMFLLPSGLTTRSDGQDRDHPIVLEGYKKNEFASLLKVMYPTAKFLIPGGNLELDLKKEEWVSVLKLSTIWNMTKIRQCAIHWLSSKVTLSPIEKILLARENKVGAWLDEAFTNLTTCNPMPTLEDLATLGWETVARILWIRHNAITLRFRRDTIKCGYCSTSSGLIDISHQIQLARQGQCEHAVLTFAAASPILNINELMIPLWQIYCPICRQNAFDLDIIRIVCNACGTIYSFNPQVRVTPDNSLRTMIEEMFGEEIKGYEQNLLQSQTTNNFDISQTPGKDEIA